MAFQSPPGLARPSSWPVRLQRRHAAVTTFNAEVLQRLQDNALTHSALADTVQNLSNKIDMLINRFDSPVASQTSHAEPVDLLARVESMELLLFRTSLENFGKIDLQLKRNLQTIQEP